jgi:hypothetical protein
MEVQYWLAELDQHGNPELIDGAHSNAQGASQAAYLIKAMSLSGDRPRKFAIARVELSECAPTAAGVNLEAVRAINMMREQTGGLKYVSPQNI